MRQNRASILICEQQTALSGLFLPWFVQKITVVQRSQMNNDGVDM